MRLILSGEQICKAVEHLDPKPVTIGLPYGVETDICYVEWADGHRAKIVDMPRLHSPRREVLAVGATDRYQWVRL